MMPRRLRPLGLAAVAAITAGLLAGCVATTQPGVTARPVAGSCHALTQQEEYAVESDSSPSVPCASAHTTETFLVSALPAPFSSDRARPNAAARAQIAGQVCTGDALRGYVGAAYLDGLYGLWTVSFLPTAQAWHGGARWIRCDVVQTSVDDALRPVVRRATLHAALRGSTSSALLRCYDQRAAGGGLASAARQVPCDRPHTSRDLDSWTPVSSRPTAADFRAACAAPVHDYLRAPPRPDQVTVVVIPSSDRTTWSVRCAVVTSS